MLLTLLAFTKGLQAFGHCDVQYGYNVPIYQEFLSLTTFNTTVQPVLPGFQPTTPNGIAYNSKALICMPQACGEGVQISSWIQASFAAGGSDPQFGFAQLGFVGFDGFQFAFWLTNTKVYALYARFPHDQTPLEYYLSAVYLIPMADRTPLQTDLYELWMDANSKLVSWRMNNYQLLRIKETGTAEIDSKFMLADYGGYFPYAGFPKEGLVVMGAALPDPAWYTGSPHPACQGTLFNQCLDSLSNAKGSTCHYAPLVPQNFIPPISVNLTYTDLAVSVRRIIHTCPPWTCDLQNMNCEENPVLQEGGECEPERPDYVPARLGWQLPRQKVQLRFGKTSPIKSK